MFQYARPSPWHCSLRPQMLPEPRLFSFGDVMIMGDFSTARQHTLLWSLPCNWSSPPTKARRWCLLHRHNMFALDPTPQTPTHQSLRDPATATDASVNAYSLAFDLAFGDLTSSIRAALVSVLVQTLISIRDPDNLVRLTVIRCQYCRRTF